ncbi:MAG: hypothetical protein HKL80_09790, partial [Acidimicrobiales bacterium]|nr:hypothetical protein [Acidimicrobiales bacterium]
LKALKNSALVIETGISTNQKARSGWLKEEIAASHVKLDAQAVALIQEHLGEDLSRLAPLLETLEAAFGPTKHLSANEILPFLGSSGSTPPWALADAMDTGDSKTALIELHRLLNASSRHPLTILALLERHFDQPLRLQGVNLTTREEAAQYLGNIHPFVAQKALARSRRLGIEGLHRAITLLADADYDLRGISGLSGESVLEILVARLCQLSKTTSRR